MPAHSYIYRLGLVMLLSLVSTLSWTLPNRMQQELRMDDTNSIHAYYSNSLKTAGYGSVKIDDIVTTAHDAEAVRIGISEDRKAITVRRNNQEIESIPIDRTCPCETSTSFKEVYFATNSIAQAYVDYFVKNNRQVTHDIHTDNDIISGLSNRVVARQPEDYKELFGEVLADRLLTYEKANGRRFVVVMQEVNLLSANQASWNELAKTVFAVSGLGSNDILITLPYVTCPGIGFDSGNIFYMPGVAFGDNCKIDLPKMGKDYSNTQRTAELQAGIQPSSLWKFILDVFTHTQKQYYQRSYYIDFRGDITGRTSEEMNHSGYAGTYDYQLTIDQRFERYAEVLKISQHYLDRNDRNITQYQIDAFTKEREEAGKEYTDFTRLHPQPLDIPVAHGMNEAEGVSTVEHCEQYAEWYRDRIFAADGKSATSPPDNYFYGGKNQVVYDETKAQIDALGILLMPVSFDWIADAVGFFHSGYYADYTNSSLYASCLIIPAVSASAIRVTGDLVKGLKNGTHHIVREQGEYVIRAIDDVLEGRFIDDILETDYQKYLVRKASQGESPKGRLEWKEARDYWLNDSPLARGNAFNRKAVEEEWYNYFEVNLENGKRLDSYVPPNNGNIGEIISRKATNLEEIELSTFESYLREMQSKYAAGTKIRSNKYPELDGEIIQGKQILEIPYSNQSFSQIEEYINIAERKNIEIRFRPE